MREDMRKALLRSYDLRVEAGEIQIERGVVDVGFRSQVTSGKHLDEIAAIISEDLMSMGVSEDRIFYKNKDTEIPGWFRATKQWDILAFSDDQLITAVELKSISSSFGNNLNNRTEEAVGEAIDAKFASDRGLLNRVIPPLFAYALIVRKNEESSSLCKKPNSHHFQPNEAFMSATYLDRFRIMCERLRRENIYGAVWFVVVDPDAGEVSEPVKELSYEAFLKEIEGHVGAFAATR
jgi:type II restriction enzyme